MKKTFCFILVLTIELINAHLKAQDFYFSVGMEGVTGFSNSPSFGKFVDSYNKHFEKDLSEQLRNIGLVGGYGIQSKFFLGHYFVAVNYTHLSGSSYAKFNNGRERYFELNENFYCVSIGLGNYESGKAFAAGAINMGVNNMNVQAYQKYKDGTVSMGNENLLNGSYKGFAMLMAPQIVGGWHLSKPIVLSFNLSYHFNLLAFGNTDYFNMDEVSSNVTSGLIKANSIPEDYQKFLANPGVGSIPNDEQVKFNFHGLKLGLGIEYSFNKK